MRELNTKPKDMKITNQEFEAYQNDGNKVLSDMDMSWNPETKEFDIPAVEWCDWYGERWSRYVSEEARTAALNEYQEHMNQWVLEFRVKEQKRLEKIEAHKQYMREIKTLGGQFEVLKELKLKIEKI